MTHDLTRAEAEAVENLIAQALELRIVTRSDAHDERKVREAFGEEEPDDALEAELTAPDPNPPAQTVTGLPRSAETQARPRAR
jgi:hypothetical protein